MTVRPPEGAPDPMRQIFVRVLRELLLATAVIAVLGVGIGYLVAGGAGVAGALLGVVVALIFCGTTALSMLVSLHRPLTVLAAVILGAWLVKMLVLVVLLAAIQDLTFYDKYVFAGVLFAVVITSMAIDVRAVVKARIPNAGPA